MIGIVGKDGEGYRWLIPKPAEASGGVLRVIPFAPRRRTAVIGSINAVLLLSVVACHHDARHGLGRAWFAPFYLFGLGVMLLQGVLRLRAAMRRRTIRVALPLDLRSVPPLYVGEQVIFYSALTIIVDACIDSDHPHPVLPWDLLACVSALLCLIIALLPWFNRRFLLPRRG